MFATLTLAAALATQTPPGVFLPGMTPPKQAPMTESYTPFGTRYSRPPGMAAVLPPNMANLRQYQTRYESPMVGHGGGTPVFSGTHAAQARRDYARRVNAARAAAQRAGAARGR